MIIFSKAVMQFIKNNFDNSAEILNKEDVNDVLTVIDDLITYKGFNENYDYNDFGRQAQKIYDELYNNN